MLEITRKFKKEMQNLESCEERIDLLKDMYKDKIACIITPGPTLNNHDIDKLKKVLSRDDIVVLSVKQAYDWTKETTDFHVASTWNFNAEKGYDYSDDDTICFYGFTKAYIPEQMNKVLQKPSPCDFWIPVSTPPYHSDRDCIHVTGEFDLFYEFGKNYEMRWGNGIMYEQAVPLALHLGCKEFVTIGYDIGNPKVKENHAYPDKDLKPTPSDEKMVNEYIASTSILYDWFKKEGVNFRIFSETNPSDERFERIGDLNEI